MNAKMRDKIKNYIFIVNRSQLWQNQINLQI